MADAGAAQPAGDFAGPTHHKVLDVDHTGWFTEEEVMWPGVCRTGAAARRGNWFPFPPPREAPPQGNA